MAKYNSSVYKGHSFEVAMGQQIRWECPKCGHWLLEKFLNPWRCACGYTEEVPLDETLCKKNE